MRRKIEQFEEWENKKIYVIFIGGDYKPTLGINLGSCAIEQIKLYHFNKAFIECSGTDLKYERISLNASTKDVNIKKLFYVSLGTYI